MKTQRYRSNETWTSSRGGGGICCLESVGKYEAPSLLGKEKGSGTLSTAIQRAGGTGSTSPSTLGLAFHILLKEARYLLT